MLREIGGKMQKPCDIVVLK